jgi:transposase
VHDLKVPAAMVFSGLSPLILERVDDDGERIVVHARTANHPAPCPGCGVGSVRVHSYHQRTVTDLPVDGRCVTVRVRVRRLLCSTVDCRRSFREQVPGVLERYQRRTTRMTSQVQTVVRELAGRASVRLLAALRVGMSRHTAIRVLVGIPLPPRPVPRVLSVDDFALRRRHRYASVVVDAVTHDRVDVLPDRKADTLAVWLQEHPGVEIVVRDGSATYAEAVRRALPGARQVSDRWHLWHGLVRGVEKVVAAHSGCWAKLGPKRHSLTREKTTLERWQAVHGLLERGVGLLDCSRRLGLSLNPVIEHRQALCQGVRTAAAPPPAPVPRVPGR